MGSEVEAVLEQLERARDAEGACKAADGWAEGGRVADLAALAAALASGRGGDERTALLDHVTEKLAAAKSPEAVDAILALAHTSPDAARTRAFASRLGFATDVETFGAALLRHPDASGEGRELFACWLHELVLRGAPVAEVPAARSFHEALARSGHALGGLPLRLLPCEREATSYLPMFGEAGLEEAVESLQRGSVSMRTLPPPAEHEAPRIETEEDAGTTARLAEAVRAWKKVEAKVFRLTPPITSGDVGKWLLRALPLASLEGAPTLTADRTSADQAFGALFAAAANGGARDPGVGGAYGRLRAWTSFAALAGMQEGARPDEVDGRATQIGFVLFRAPGGWFFDVAWDVGVLALREGGATCAVVAATDAD